MDFTTIVGVLLAFILMINGITLSKIGNFIDIPSIVIVIGGTLAIIIASFPLKLLKDIPKHMKIVFKESPHTPAKSIETIVEFAQIARKNGLLALEEKLDGIEEPFFKQSVMMIVDVTDVDKIRDMLESEIDYMAARHEEATNIYSTGETLAPAFGMIGTLIGLVNMLKSLSGGADAMASIGPDMSVALITTLYGSVLGNIVFAPIGKKLRYRSNQEQLYKQIVVEGVIAIQSGDNPKNIREKLVSLLAQKERTMLGVGEGEAATNKNSKKVKKSKK